MGSLGLGHCIQAQSKEKENKFATTMGTENILRTGCDLHPPGIIFPRLELPEDGSDQA